MSDLFSQFKNMKENPNKESKDAIKFFSDIAPKKPEKAGSNDNMVAALLIQQKDGFAEVYIAILSAYAQKPEVIKCMLYFSPNNKFRLKQKKSPYIYFLSDFTFYIYDDCLLNVFAFDVASNSFFFKKKFFLNDFVSNPQISYDFSQKIKIFALINGFDISNKPAENISIYEIDENCSKISFKAILIPKKKIVNPLFFFRKNCLFLIDLKSKIAEKFDLTKVFNGDFFPLIESQAYDITSQFDKNQDIHFEFLIYDNQEKKFYLSDRNKQKFVNLKVKDANKIISLKNTNINKPLIKFVDDAGLLQVNWFTYLGKLFYFDVNDVDAGKNNYLKVSEL